MSYNLVPTSSISCANKIETVETIRLISYVHNILFVPFPYYLGYKLSSCMHHILIFWEQDSNLCVQDFNLVPTVFNIPGTQVMVLFCFVHKDVKKILSDILCAQDFKENLSGLQRLRRCIFKSVLTFHSMVKHHFMYWFYNTTTISFLLSQNLLLITGVFTNHTLTFSSRLNPTLCNFVHFA